MVKFICDACNKDVEELTPRRITYKGEYIVIELCNDCFNKFVNDSDEFVKNYIHKKEGKP